MTISLRRALGALAATSLMLTGAIAAVAPASVAAQAIPTMTGIRTGQNPGFDRIVLDLTAGPAPTVRYDVVVELIADGSGEIVWLTGEYFIAVTATPAAAHNDAGNPTYPGPQKFRTRDLRNAMAVAVTGDYEATLSIGLGVRSRTAVSVFTLSSPNRVVIDVRH